MELVDILRSRIESLHYIVFNSLNPPSSFLLYFVRKEGLGPRLDRWMDLMSGNPAFTQGVLLITNFRKHWTVVTWVAIYFC